MVMAVQSALVLFDVDLPNCDEPRQLRIFIDGVYQETRWLLPGDRLIAGTYAPLHAMVRIDLLGGQLRWGTTLSFIATNERKTISSENCPGMAVRVLGELFEFASAAAT